MLGRDHPAVGGPEALVLEAVRVGIPAEVMVERPVLHHQDHEVIDLHVARARHVGPAMGGLGGFGEDRAGGKAGGQPGQAGAVRSPLQKFAA